MQTQLNELLKEFVRTARKQEDENRAYNFAGLVQQYDAMMNPSDDFVRRVKLAGAPKTCTVETCKPGCEVMPLDHLPEGSH